MNVFTIDFTTLSNEELLFLQSKVQNECIRRMSGNPVSVPQTTVPASVLPSTPAPKAISTPAPVTPKEEPAQTTTTKAEPQKPTESNKEKKERGRNLGAIPKGHIFVIDGCFMLGKNFLPELTLSQNGDSYVFDGNIFFGAMVPQSAMKSCGSSYLFHHQTGKHYFPTSQCQAFGTFIFVPGWLLGKNRDKAEALSEYNLQNVLAKYTFKKA